MCGRCVRVYGDESGATGAGVLFKIIDECASGCGSGSLDFSRTGLEATTGFTWDQKKIVWEWAPCDAAKVLYGARGRSRKGSSKKHKGRKMLDAAEQQA